MTLYEFVCQQKPCYISESISQDSPRNGQLEIDVEVGLVVVLAHPQRPGEPEVRDLDLVLAEHQDVARGEVSATH